jgi:hypothetical protein
MLLLSIPFIQSMGDDLANGIFASALFLSAMLAGACPT